MKILLMCLMIIVKGTSDQDKTRVEQSPGFSVEIRNDSEPGIAQEVFVDLASISDLPKDSVVIKDSGGKSDRTWIGVNLCSIFEKKLTLSCRQIKKISISAPDGYVSVISGELLSALATGMCAMQIKGEGKWPAKYGYLRLLFPQLRAMYWVNAPNKMIIELGEVAQASASYSFYFLESENFKSVIKKDLKDNPYTAIDDLLINLDAAQQPFRILTQDSLFREYGANDINRRLVLQQETTGTWKLTGIAVPLGLKTRNIFLLATQNKALVLKSLSAAEQDVFCTSYVQSMLKNLPDKSNMMIEIVGRDGNSNPAEPIPLPIETSQNLYRIIEQQRQIHKNLDHINLIISSH